VRQSIEEHIQGRCFTPVSTHKKMRFILALVFLVASAVAQDVAFANGARFQEVAASSKSPCFPDCKWQCDTPTCPAVCEPQCEKPACELRCEKLAETACDIRCEKPKCEVRCSRKNCQSGGCPLCENVCLPAKCQTVCTPAVPNCKPTCSAPKCTWSCRKPTTCPKPKCNLACNQKPTSACGKPHCCSCHKFNNMVAAVEMASSTHLQQHGAVPEDMPALIEVAHDIRLGDSEQNQCCPCAQSEEEQASF